jgi:predicted Ser/Thr protein kinase
MVLNMDLETGISGGLPAAATLPPEAIAPDFPQLEILECLGRGGMGVVYKARQKILNRVVALKLLAPERAQDPKFAERFAHEAQALAALNHPNIVAIHDFGVVTGKGGGASLPGVGSLPGPAKTYYLVMEYVAGANLRHLLRARKFAPEEALAIVPPLCDALQYAHEHGIVHRDIKPENIMLDTNGRVKIADFGIARMLGNSRAGDGIAVPDDTSTSVVGTRGYCAPEQEGAPEHVDSRADIYSLGIVFYEMLTGELPGKPIEPPSHKVLVDVRLDEVVLKALAQNPELRYQQASEVKTDLETFARSKSGPMAETARTMANQHPPRWGLPLVVFLSLYTALACYLAVSMRWLPERMASHFGADLVADGWMARGPFLFFLATGPLVLPLVFTMLCALFRLVLEMKWLAAYLYRQQLWYASLFVGFFAGIEHLTAQANRQTPARLPAIPFAILIAGFLVATLVFVTTRIYQLVQPYWRKKPMQTQDNTMKSSIVFTSAILAICAATTLGVCLAGDKNNDGAATASTNATASQTTSADATPKDQAEAAAGAWLKIIDQGKYAESWEETDSTFQGAVSEAAWKNSLEKLRQPMGNLVSRKLRAKQSVTEMPGAPDGEYVVMQFETSLSNKKSAVETVTVGPKKDGKWRVSGYFIK